MVPGHPVAHGTHAAGVGGHVAPEGSAPLARGHRVDQAERRQLGIQLGQRDPGLHHRHLVLGVDLADLPHAVERQEDPLGHGHGSPREAGPAAARHDGDAVPVGQPQDLGHFAGRTGHDQGQRHGRDAGERLVVPIVRMDELARYDLLFADDLVERFEEFGHGGGRLPPWFMRGRPTLPASGGS